MSDFFCHKKQFFYIVQTYFLKDTSFWVVESILCLVETISFFSSIRNLFFEEFFIPAIREGYSVEWKPSTLLESSFLLGETVTDMENHFLKRDLILASENSFSS